MQLEQNCFCGRKYKILKFSQTFHNIFETLTKGISLFPTDPMELVSIMIISNFDQFNSNRLILAGALLIYKRIEFK